MQRTTRYERCRFLISAMQYVNAVECIFEYVRAFDGVTIEFVQNKYDQHL